MKTLHNIGKHDTQTIQVNWNDVESIEYAELRKQKLENNGYTFIETISKGLFIDMNIYRKEV